jgi:hypothetical protein
LRGDREQLLCRGEVEDKVSFPKKTPEFLAITSKGLTAEEREEEKGTLQNSP